MAAVVHPFMPFSASKCPGDGNTHLRLMSQLRSWMPAHLFFCHHCLQYRRSLDFSTQDLLTGPRLCFRCSSLGPPRSHSSHRFTCDDEPEYWEGCDGCDTFQGAEELWEALEDEGLYGPGLELWVDHGPVEDEVQCCDSALDDKRLSMND